MADESAEHKTLLKTEGDASGAKRAAQETQDALGQVDNAQGRSGHDLQLVQPRDGQHASPERATAEPNSEPVERPS